MIKEIDQETFDSYLLEEINKERPDFLLQIPGIYEILAEYYNNDIIEKYERDEKDDYIRKLEKAGFIDGIDASLDVSFWEYGLLRNHKTNHVIYCFNGESNNPLFDYTICSIDDAKEFLMEVDEGFFDFIDSNREDEIKNLKNEYLSGIIQAANQYNGYFQQDCARNHDLDSLIERGK